MAEYKNVEKPFLDKLREMDWDVIDHGAFGIPQDPSSSLRSSFKEVTLKQTFLKVISNWETGVRQQQEELQQKYDDIVEALYPLY